MAASSPPPVNTYWPFLPLTIAVPVSWHIGSTPPAAIDGVLQQVEGDEAVVVAGLGVVEDLAQLGQVGRAQVVGDVVHRLGGEPAVIASGSTLRNVPSGVSNVDTPSVVTQPVRVGVGTEREQLGVGGVGCVGCRIGHGRAR